MNKEYNKSEAILRRFLRYVRINTQSDENSNSVPSTISQLKLAKVLHNELKEMGVFDVNLDQKGYLMAGIPSNCNKKQPIIGLLAHMDTSPDFTAENVNPIIHKNYDGEELLLNSELNIKLSPKDFPELKNYIGKTIITTDGNTLLGADNKAGIAIIMTVIEFFTKHPEIKHGGIRIAFTPDEEIARGADYFDVKKFNADFAYTIDGGEIGELEFENFNAAIANIKIHGRNVHPGTAKGKMINASLIANKIINSLPENEIPENTENYEGFFHLTEVNSNVELAELKLLIRDHSRQSFEKRKALLTSICSKINSTYKKEVVDLVINQQPREIPGTSSTTAFWFAHSQKSCFTEPATS
jgi:tripeptide aminopeptidase